MPSPDYTPEIKPINPYSERQAPPPDKRVQCFLRWQRMKRASLASRIVFKTITDTQIICACGGIKPRAAELCQDCRDMRRLINNRIPPAHLPDDTEKRYSPRLLSVYQSPGRIIRPRPYLEEPDGAQENAVRALEENGEYE